MGKIRNFWEVDNLSAYSAPFIIHQYLKKTYEIFDEQIRQMEIKDDYDSYCEYDYCMKKEME